MSKTHKMSKTRPYVIWKGIKSRCYNKKSYAFVDYGGRGIGMCDKWLGFEGFWEDMQDGYNDTLTIDRIDTNGNYCKENCRWATREEQNRNKRSNVFFEIEGKKMILPDIAKKYNIPYKRLKARIELLKKPIQEAINMGKNEAKYYYFDKKRKVFVTEVTYFGGRTFLGRFKNEIDAKIAVKNYIKKFVKI